MNTIKNKIKTLAKSYHQEVIAIRRHLHQYPELSFHEVETGKYIAKILKEFGIPHEHGIAENGVVGLIKGKKPNNKTIALRGDFDALPITERNEIDYKSKNEGVMHACGHDVHTSSLLGVAKILNQIKEEFEGTIKLIFQPGEEQLPGGASIMIKEGVLENPKPSLIFGQHVHPPLEVGKVGFKPGLFMSSNDGLYLTIKGKGGHGALPQDCVDPIPIMAQMITALQQIVSRKANPTIPTVLTFGNINTIGGATNIIPNEIRMEGTFRTMNEKWRGEAHQLMLNLATKIAESMGGSCEFKIVKGVPFLWNDELATLNAKQNAISYLGAENVVDLPIRMTSEDFAFYSQKMPAVFYRLGTGNIEKGITASVHTNTFNIDEDALEVSIGLMAWLAVCELNKNLNTTY